MTAIKSPTMSNIRRLAKSLGAEVTDAGEMGDVAYCIDTPSGKMWICGLHTLVLCWQKYEAGAKEKAIADALERMGGGLVDCTDPRCEYCCNE